MVAKHLEETTVDPGLPGTDSPLAITFSPFRLDLRRGLLLRGTKPIPLRPKTWAVLLYLAERPGVLVAKNELLDALWPDVAVTPDTLNKSIGELRVALGDDSRAPRFIQTVNRRGYRFIAVGMGRRPRPRNEKIFVRDDSGISNPIENLGTETRRAVASDRAPGGTPTAFVDRAEPRPEPSKQPFVGREEELQLLTARLAKAHAGERQIVFVTGPAGVGKTALVDAFLESRAVCETAAPVWIGRAGCFEHHGPHEAYLPVFEALERLARPPNVERLVRLMRRAAPMWLAQMPWLVGEADAAALRQSLQGVRAERMPRELAVLIEALTTDLTLVLVLEDLHWSDPSTVDLLTLLAQRRDPARLLVIGTYRPAEVAVHEHLLASAVRTLQVQRQCVEVPLHDLTEEAVRTLSRAAFPRQRPSPPRSRSASTRIRAVSRCSSSRSSTT